MTKIFFKWTLLVWLNAAVSLFLVPPEYKNIYDFLGIVCGIFTFVIFYSFVDYYLDAQNRKDLRKLLLYSVIVKSTTQLVFIIEMITGLISIEIVSSVIGKRAFITTYFITLVAGILLSILVMFLMVILKVLSDFYMNYRIKKSEV